jgi:activator of HSP90 ATPase
MDQSTRGHFTQLHGTDAESRAASFMHLLELTQQPVEWAHEVWDELLTLLREGDNHQRAIGAQLLSSLAKSDSQQRMLKDLDQLMVVTKDERFVTARHSLQSLWRVGTASPALQKEVVDRLSERFRDCITEKNGTLIRYDILEVFRKIYDRVHDEQLKEHALALIETEEDSKYRKKYSGLWKDLVAKKRGAKG